jgi:hypothetical protein
MRLLVLSGLLLPVLLACNEENPAPLFLDIDYQVRCLDCEPRAPDSLRHNFATLDGEQGFTLLCSTADQGGDRLLSFSATYLDPEGAESKNFSIRLISANLDANDPGNGCRVVATEGGNTYEGHCTAAEPSGDDECQVKLDVEHHTVVGSILCEKFPNRSTNEVVRYLVKGGSDKPADFVFEGCKGL